MSYNPNFTPDAPLPVSMLPSAEPLSPNDQLLITQLANVNGKTRRLSLGTLAAFLGQYNFTSIQLRGEGGSTLILSGDGSVFTAAGSAMTITQDDEGIKLHAAGDQFQQPSLTVSIDSEGIKVGSVVQGLNTSAEFTPEKITMSTQQRQSGVVKTIKTELTYGMLATHLVRVLGDGGDAGDWNLTMDLDPASSTYGGLIVGNLAGTAVVHVPCLHVWKQSTFEKDVTVNADMTISQTLTVTQGATLGTGTSIAGANIGYLTTKTMDVSLDTAVNYSLIKASAAGSSITLPNYVVGRRMMVLNDSSSDVSITNAGALPRKVSKGEIAEFIKVGSTASGWYPVNGSPLAV